MFYNIENLIKGVLFSCIALFSCSKIVDAGAPKTTSSSANTFSNDDAAIGAMTGMYVYLSNAQLRFSNSLLSIGSYSGLSADELNLSLASPDPEQTVYFKNQLSGSILPSYGYTFWDQAYAFIYKANSVIAGIENSSQLTPVVKRQLSGEAKFMRAFSYFYLVNLYGDAPIILGTDPNVNAVKSRSPKEQIYSQMINDLLEAKDLLSDNFVDKSLINKTTERVRPTKWAAMALLARVYLFAASSLNQNDKWQKAEEQASAVIGYNNFSIATVPLNKVFLKNSQEAIWQIQPSNTGLLATWDGYFYVLPAGGPSGTNPCYINPSLFASFETGDPRKAEWINSVAVGTTTYYYPSKYKLGASATSIVSSPSQYTEYTMVLRLAEQYLIRAEARAKQNNISGAVDDLNVIRTRARGTAVGVLPNLLPTLTQSQVIDAIAKERRNELFTEWGHRWLDMKRTGTVDAIMSVETPLKGGVWNSYQQLYPLNPDEIRLNSNLTQNPGY